MTTAEEGMQDSRLVGKIIRLAKVARTASQAQITTKRMGSQLNQRTGRAEPTIRDNVDEVGSEAIIFQALLQRCLSESDLREGGT